MQMKTKNGRPGSRKSVACPGKKKKSGMRISTWSIWAFSLCSSLRMRSSTCSIWCMWSRAHSGDACRMAEEHFFDTEFWASEAFFFYICLHVFLRSAPAPGMSVVHVAFAGFAICCTRLGLETHSFCAIKVQERGRGPAEPYTISPKWIACILLQTKHFVSRFRRVIEAEVCIFGRNIWLCGL